MKVTIERSAFLRSLAHVQSVVQRRSTVPILLNVLLQAGDGVLTLVATDLELEVTERVPAMILQPGALTVPAATLHDITRKLPDGAQVELDASGDLSALALRCGRSKFRLGALPAEDYPRMRSDAGNEIAFTIPVDDLKALFDRTRFAMSTEETRYFLNGIFLHAPHTHHGQVLRAVATDGHRLARMELPLPEGASALPDAIIPRKTVTELRKLLDETDQPVDITLSNTRMRASWGNLSLVSTLIDGQYPDYERVIPANNERRLVVDPKSFTAAVDRVATIITDKSRAVKLSLGRNLLTLSAQSVEAGSATEEIEVDYTAEAMEIGFNSRYLLEIAQQIGGADILFRLDQPDKATLISDGDDRAALYVLMPMRV